MPVVTLRLPSWEQITSSSWVKKVSFWLLSSALLMLRAGWCVLLDAIRLALGIVLGFVLGFGILWAFLGSLVSFGFSVSKVLYVLISLLIKVLAFII